MKKVSDNWSQAFPAGMTGVEFFPEFETRAKTAAAEVLRVPSITQARNVLENLLKELKVQKVVAAKCPLQQAADIETTIRALGIEYYGVPEDIAAHAETADIGISGVEFGVAETGSVCQDAYAIESRLVSTLPPIHVVFMQSRNVVPGITEAFDIISKVFDCGYISFITGPSRTADIERVLTIGVHGPSRFIIIAIDDDSFGGEA